MIYTTQQGCLIRDVYLDLCCNECKIWVMKDKVICLSDVMSVKAIITAVIYSLSEAPAVVQKTLLVWVTGTYLPSVSFSLTKKNRNFRFITPHWKMFGWILNSFPKPLRAWNLLNLERTMSVWSSNKNNYIFFLWHQQQRLFSLPKERDSLAAHTFQTTDRGKAVFNKPLVVEGNKCKQSSISCTHSSDETIAAKTFMQRCNLTLSTFPVTWTTTLMPY